MSPPPADGEAAMGKGKWSGSLHDVDAIDIAVGGYTPELIAAMQEMNKQMQGQSAPRRSGTL